MGLRDRAHGVITLYFPCSGTVAVLLTYSSTGPAGTGTGTGTLSPIELSELWRFSKRHASSPLVSSLTFGHANDACARKKSLLRVVVGPATFFLEVEFKAPSLRT